MRIYYRTYVHVTATNALCVRGYKNMKRSNPFDIQSMSFGKPTAGQDDDCSNATGGLGGLEAQITRETKTKEWIRP